MLFIQPRQSVQSNLYCWCFTERLPLFSTVCLCIYSILPYAIISRPDEHRLPASIDFQAGARVSSGKWSCCKILWTAVAKCFLKIVHSKWESRSHLVFHKVFSISIPVFQKFILGDKSRHLKMVWCENNFKITV